MRWELRLAAGEAELESVLLDTAEQYEPDLTAERPEAEALVAGGRGIPLARSLLDRPAVRRVGGRNEWRMVRRLGRRD